MLRILLIQEKTYVAEDPIHRTLHNDWLFTRSGNIYWDVLQRMEPWDPLDVPVLDALHSLNLQVYHWSVSNSVSILSFLLFLPKEEGETHQSIWGVHLQAKDPCYMVPHRYHPQRNQQLPQWHIRDLHSVQCCQCQVHKGLVYHRLLLVLTAHH